MKLLTRIVEHYKPSTISIISQQPDPLIRLRAFVDFQTLEKTAKEMDKDFRFFSLDPFRHIAAILLLVSNFHIMKHGIAR